ncbi:MAG: transcription termination/antitermination protein NusA [Lachnospiraceae bacterium]|nr:transcription termination/antitermination protein NusA [Lachnospiraceae bacterium]MBP5276669.1 transcription termination/antitermination protein NusA [Lachnospiraceae bacterium]MBQ4275486.1 transcription termination/antitermination protein NusA [Lachnospiraceae bacterium]MCR4696233.1 transcription termination factor NusA [Lachnospiraceae bacterium]
MAKENKVKDSEELMRAIAELEKEKEISKDTLFEAIENSLKKAAKEHFGNDENCIVEMDRETGEYHLYQEKTVVETADDITDPVTQVDLEEAKKVAKKAKAGDVVRFELQSKEFGRIATQHAKSVILQKIREEERNVVFDQYYSKQNNIVIGVVQRYIGKNISINLGKADAILNESEQVKGEHFRPTDRIKVFITEVKNTPKGPRILVSRTHPGFVKRLFEAEVSEIRDGIVEIKSIAREPGSRTKMAVYSKDENVDPVGACVGLNGARVNAIVDELGGEKIDIINWSFDANELIQNALSPAQVIAVAVNEEDPKSKEAMVIVPDSQLSLAIGKEGQNARLAAKLTGFKIDIKSESQAREAFGFSTENEEFEYDDNVEYDENAVYDEEYVNTDEIEEGNVEDAE